MPWFHNSVHLMLRIPRCVVPRVCRLVVGLVWYVICLVCCVQFGMMFVLGRSVVCYSYRYGVWFGTVFGSVWYGVYFGTVFNLLWGLAWFSVWYKVYFGTVFSLLWGLVWFIVW